MNKPIEEEYRDLILSHRQISFLKEGPRLIEELKNEVATLGPKFDVTEVFKKIFLKLGRPISFNFPPKIITQRLLQDKYPCIEGRFFVKFKLSLKKYTLSLCYSDGGLIIFIKNLPAAVNSTGFYAQNLYFDGLFNVVPVYTLQNRKDIQKIPVQIPPLAIAAVPLLREDCSHLSSVLLLKKIDVKKKAIGKKKQMAFTVYYGLDLQKLEEKMWSKDDLLKNLTQYIREDDVLHQGLFIKLYRFEKEGKKVDLLIGHDYTFFNLKILKEQDKFGISGITFCEDKGVSTFDYTFLENLLKVPSTQKLSQLENTQNSTKIMECTKVGDLRISPFCKICHKGLVGAAYKTIPCVCEDQNPRLFKTFIFEAKDQIGSFLIPLPVLQTLPKHEVFLNSLYKLKFKKSTKGYLNVYEIENIEALEIISKEDRQIFQKEIFEKVNALKQHDK
jgi:hypothetical protein